jgi:hypothetical protein
MKNYIKYFFLISILILNFNFNLYSQTPNKYGIKAGLILTGIQSINNPDNVIEYQNAFYNFFSYDFGIYKEWTFSRMFGVSTELHYILKGESRQDLKLSIITATQPFIVVENNYIPDRFNYISAQLLPRIMFAQSNKVRNSNDVWFLYLFGGPTFNMLLSSSSSNASGSSNTIPLKKGKIEVGAMLGLGSEMFDFLSIEFRMEHIFNGPFNVVYPDYTLTRVHNSLYFLVGFAFNKLFEKERLNHKKKD